MSHGGAEPTVHDPVRRKNSLGAAVTSLTRTIAGALFSSRRKTASVPSENASLLEGEDAGEFFGLITGTLQGGCMKAWRTDTRKSCDRGCFPLGSSIGSPSDTCYPFCRSRWRNSRQVRSGSCSRSHRGIPSFHRGPQRLRPSLRRLHLESTKRSAPSRRSIRTRTRWRTRKRKGEQRWGLGPSSLLRIHCLCPVATYRMPPSLLRWPLRRLRSRGSSDRRPAGW